MRLWKKIKTLVRSIRWLRKYSKIGGCVTANIAYPQYREILKNKRICVTGGTSGIGLAIAIKFIQCGAKVLITGRNKEKMNQALKELGENAAGILWDISNVQSSSEKIAEAKKNLGGDIDILINNAGIAPTKFWGNVDEAEWDKIYDTNLKGMFFLTQNLVNDWRKSKIEGYRKIINISSQGGFVGATYPYRMTKWDIRGFTEGLGKALISERIIVNGIAPGVVKTTMQNFAINQGDNLFTDQNPIQRVCLPEEIAELALFLASDASNFIIGQTIICDGGYTLK